MRPSPACCVLVTRPLAQAGAWVERLRGAGLRAEALPLIGIEAADDPAALRSAWDELPARALVVFVSPNAVTQFFAFRPAGTLWPPGVQAASPGPGTTEALRRLGVPTCHIAEPAHDALQFDSESLWAALSRQDWQGARVLLVRGPTGRDWLAERLAERGAIIEVVAAYRRCAPQFDAARQALLACALARPGEHLWYFSSSEAIGHLCALTPGADWSAASALATHPRIADRARAAGWRRVLEAQPHFAAVVACIQSLAS